jgi:hypothetical protein
MASASSVNARQAERRWHLGAEFAVAAAEVLYKDVAVGDSGGRPEALESAHGPQPSL